MITPIAELKELVIAKLRKELPKEVFYHSPEHTLDVMSHAIELSRLENLTATESNLVGIAALFHDTGYIFTHSGHELYSCKIARIILFSHGYAENDIQQICVLIMATKIPQNPFDKLAMVLCDADLDYLGRDDFFTLGEKTIS